MNFMEMLDEISRMTHHGMEEQAERILEEEERRCDECGEELTQEEMDAFDSEDRLCFDCYERLLHEYNETTEHPDYHNRV